jgi:hypothetical protein
MNHVTRKACAALVAHFSFLPFIIIIIIACFGTGAEAPPPPPPPIPGMGNVTALCEAMADECLADADCCALYAMPAGLPFPGPEHDHWSAVLERDLIPILLSHGLRDATCAQLLASFVAGDLDLVPLAEDLHAGCADLRDAADSRAATYTTLVASVLFLVVLVAFLAAFVIMGARKESEQHRRY